MILIKELFSDIASKEVNLDDALEVRLFQVYGDIEVWQRQLKVLREILTDENFTPRPKPPPKEEPEPEPEDSFDILDDEESIDYNNLPIIDLSTVPKEFQFLTDPFEALRDKYNLPKNETSSNQAPKK